MRKPISFGAKNARQSKLTALRAPFDAPSGPHRGDKAAACLVALVPEVYRQADAATYAPAASPTGSRRTHHG